jgi:hypothetical protein
MLMAGSMLELSAMPRDNAAILLDYDTSTSQPVTPESHIESLGPKLGLTTVTYTSWATTPSVRTLPRSPRLQTRIDSYSVAVRTIDSTQAKSRAGLFNHKILFYTHPRHYYLNGLVRLII